MKQDVSGNQSAAGQLPSARRPKKAKPERHRWLDQWMVAKGKPLRELVANVTRLVDRRERAYFARKRARKAADLANHRRAIDGVVTNLAYAALSPPATGRLASNTRHGDKGRSRYDSPAFGKTLPNLLHVLWQEGVLDYKHSPGRGEVSSIAPSSWFAQKVVEHGITFADFGRDPSEELILLSRNSRGDVGSSGTVSGRKSKERIEYRDTPTTRSYRDAVRRLNAFLAEADIAFIEDGMRPLVDPFARTLTRRFVMLEKQQGPRFDQSGRLFGGFWMSLDKQRRTNIRIDGEPVATLDYSSMFTRLAYAELGERPPSLDDLYAVPGLSGYRSGVKMAMNVLLFDTHSRRSKWPAKMGVGVGSDADRDLSGSSLSEFEGLLPTGWSVGRTRKALLSLHPALRHAWGRSLGYRLMWRESEVLMAVLEELMRRNIPALGLHDGLLVPASKKDVAREVMIDQARAVVGVALRVSEKD